MCRCAGRLKGPHAAEVRCNSALMNPATAGCLNSVRLTRRTQQPSSESQTEPVAARPWPRASPCPDPPGSAATHLQPQLEIMRPPVHLVPLKVVHQGPGKVGRQVDRVVRHRAAHAVQVPPAARVRQKMGPRPRWGGVVGAACARCGGSRAHIAVVFQSAGAAWWQEGPQAPACVWHGSIMPVPVQLAVLISLGVQHQSIHTAYTWAFHVP
jgi:hypothetical protein